jgi:hypothetical protein
MSKKLASYFVVYSFIDIFYWYLYFTTNWLLLVCYLFPANEDESCKNVDEIKTKNLRFVKLVQEKATGPKELSLWTKGIEKRVQNRILVKILI